MRMPLNEMDNEVVNTADILPGYVKLASLPLHH